MYLPYLRGKQFELIALREFAKANPNNKNICPIIEPVKTSFNSMNTAIDIMVENHLEFALILNPKEGDYKRENKDIINELPILSNPENTNFWIPAFIVNNNFEEINNIINKKLLNNIMLIFKGSIDIEDEKVMGLIRQNNIKFIVYGDANSRNTKRALDREEKLIIRLDNNFIVQRKNADYSDILEEKFTEEHLFYDEDGFSGFSDYTTLPNDFTEGGMLPYAVAIHLTYQKTNNEIWLRHFVSDTNDSNSNIQLKFKEAANKAIDFFTNKTKTPAITELEDYITKNQYPGLGVIKKISIRNHIELINLTLTK